MRTLALILAVVLSTAAAGAAGLIILPAPSMALALAAIVASERSAFIVGAALVALVLAIVGAGSGGRVAFALAILLGLAAIGIGLVPLVQARQLARARGVPLDLGRYLRARVDNDWTGQPDRKVTYTRVAETAPTPGTASSPPNERPLVLDVYLPTRRPTTPGRPLLVIHGGFWSAGKRGEAAVSSRRLADLGFTVFDVEYRIAPQPNWQSAVGDVKCAIGWIKSHATATDWNYDPTKLALLGRSAGGHLALMAAYTAQERDLPPSCPAKDTTVDAVIALYAPTDLPWAYENPGNPLAADSPERLRTFLGGAPQTEADRYRALSPVFRVTSAAPRTLLVQGGRDQLVRPEQMDRLVGELRAHAVAFDTLFIPYAQHAFDFVVGGFSSQILEATILEFLRPPRPSD
jgi:acetyl esterase/lipase